MPSYNSSAPSPMERSPAVRCLVTKASTGCTRFGGKQVVVLLARDHALRAFCVSSTGDQSAFDRTRHLITCCSITLRPKSHRMISMPTNPRFEGTRFQASPLHCGGSPRPAPPTPIRPASRLPPAAFTQQHLLVPRTNVLNGGHIPNLHAGLSD